MDDENEQKVDEEITITRSDFNGLIEEYVDNTIEMIKTILTKNSLKTSDIQFTLMVGGSTYIPYVRQRVEEVLQIPINCEIDPTTAVTIGAAYYAATKAKEFVSEDKIKKASRIKIKSAYQKISKEKEELFSARISGDLTGLSYRIKRDDGGFDTGLKPLIDRINEDLPLVENTYNFFKLSIYDNKGNLIENDYDLIEINSGFGISGQPLPKDICLEVDDEEATGETKLLLAFQKNSILPLKKTFNRVLNKTVLKGSTEEVIRINVLEGPNTSLPEANKSIGYMEITGKNISRDIQKGSDIEITLQITESRDLSISVYLNMADQEFKYTFNPKERYTPVNLLKVDIENLSEKIEDEIEEANLNQSYDILNELTKLRKEIGTIYEESELLSEDDVTDKRYQLEDKKRKLAQSIDNATKDKRLDSARTEYFETKEKCLELLNDNGNDYERKHFNDLVSQEEIFLVSTIPSRIREKQEEIHSLYLNILWRAPEFLTNLFHNLIGNSQRMNDLSQAKSLIDAGRFAQESQNWERLTEINHALFNLLPKNIQNDVTTKIGF